MPGNPSCAAPPASSSRRSWLSPSSSGSARCLLPPSSPSSPPASSGALGDGFKPLAHLSAWTRSQFPWQTGPQIGLAIPWEPTQSPRGGRTRPLPHPPGQGPLPSWSPKAPSSLCCSSTEKGNTGTQLLEAAFPMGPLSQSPVLLVHLGNCADKRRQKQLVAPVTAGGSAFLWKHQSRDKNNARQCRGAVCPCLRPGPGPCPCLSSELLL